MKNRRCTLGTCGLIILAALCGCRHGVNPNGPVAPMNLLTPQTKVPPPATGSYSIPGGYYQGQARGPASQPSHLGSTEEPAIGSGVAQVASATPASSSPLTPLPGWTDYSPRYSTVQPASHQTASHQTASHQTASHQTTSHETSRVSSPTTSPNFNASNFNASSSNTSGGATNPGYSDANADLRPQLRGMQVVDMTRSNKPDASVESGQGSESTATQAATQPATRPDSSTLPWRDPLDP